MMFQFHGRPRHHCVSKRCDVLKGNVSTYSALHVFGMSESKVAPTKVSVIFTLAFI